MLFPVADGFAWVSLILFVASLLSSPFGAPIYSSTDFTTATVCSTKSGNNTYVSYNVTRYNETKLILSCPGEVGRSAYWTRADGSVVCTSRDCTINSNRRLTNDDSGDYLCKTSVENGTDYQVIHINVLAPPQLHNVVGCWGNEEDECTLAQNTDISPNTPYYINITYVGNGPFYVDWYHNSTKFMCSIFKFCKKIEIGSTYQTLHLEAFNLRDTMLMSGLYSAVVRNPYGTNESFIRLEYSCKTSDHTPSKITVDLQEGSMLNEFCGTTMQSAQWMFACITKNMSATFADLWNDPSGCAICGNGDLGQECSFQFNSSITNITVNRLEDDSCPPMQLMNFIKNDVTVKDDDGVRIICAQSYSTELSHYEWQPYTSIDLRVSHLPNDHSHQVSVTVSSTVVCLVISLVVALIVASCVVVMRKKKHQHHDDDDGSLVINETTRLLGRQDGHEQEPFIQGQNDQYGTMSVLEVFPYELGSQGPVGNVTIPASTGEPDSQEPVENITVPASTGDSGELGSPEPEGNVTITASTGELGSEGHDVNV